jgi:hypothetical protein
MVPNKPRQFVILCPAMKDASSKRARASKTPDASLLAPQRSRRLWGLCATLFITLAARLYYYYAVGIRFDATGLPDYFQFIDPILLKNRLLESIYYLREQPPLFNLFLGLVLKAAPVSYVSVFHTCFILTGLVLAASLYWLLIDMGLPILLAVIATSIYMANPATLVYENWLLYEYPLTALMALAAFLLYQFVARGRPWSGHAFFGTLAAIVLLRGTFHVVWMMLIVAGVVFLPGMRLRTLAKCCAVPLCLAAAFYIKHYAVFGEFISGEVYRKLNYSMMRTAPLPYDDLIKLVEQHKISPVSILPFYVHPVTKYQAFLPPFRDTGIAVLDQVQKESGLSNWHHYAMPLVADLYFRDAKVIDGLRPDLYWNNLSISVRWYFRPANETLALYDPPCENVIRAQDWLMWGDRILTGQLKPGKVGWLNVVFLPLALIYGIVQVAGGARQRLRRIPMSPESTARLAVLAFCTFNTLYISTSTILLSYGDHNRYRFSLMPLFYVLIAAMVIDCVRMLRGPRKPLPAASAPQGKKPRTI